MKDKRFTDRQIKTAAAELALLLTAVNIQKQVDHYNQPNLTLNATQLDDLYIHQTALLYKQ